MRPWPGDDVAKLGLREVIRVTHPDSGSAAARLSSAPTAVVFHVTSTMVTAGDDLRRASTAAGTPPVAVIRTVAAVLL
jgi:hypothetical protein